MELQADQLPDIYVKTDNDKTDCFITGSTILTGQKLLLCDYYNDKVILVNAEENSVLYKVKVETSPWDCTTVGHEQAPVTLPEAARILLVRANNIISIGKCLEVNGKCRGIAYSQGRLIVSFEHPSMIQILDLEGVVLKHVTSHTFSWPLYVDVSLDGSTIYVCDYNKCSVTSLTNNGTLRYTCQGLDLKGPAKACTNITGTIFLCSAKTDTVFVMTADCRLVKPILMRRNGLYKPMTTSVDGETNQLFVWMLDNNIKVYKIQ